MEYKKLTELKDKEALDRVADLLDPITVIITNPKVMEASKISRLNGVKVAFKECGDAVIELLAVYNGIPVPEYHCTAISAIKELMELISTPELQEVFTSAKQNQEA